MAQRLKTSHFISRIADSYNSFENDAIVHTFNTYSHSAPSENVTAIERGDHHTLVKCSLKCIDSEGVERQVGSCEMKTKAKLPACPSHSAFEGLMKQVLNVKNCMFDDNHQVRALMMDHVAECEDDRLCDDESFKSNGLQTECFLNFFSFGNDCSCYRSTKQGWSLGSFVGSCEFSGRDIVRSALKCELDWCKQAEGLKCLQSSLQHSGLTVGRYLVTASKVGCSFVLDTVFLPTSAPLSHVFNVGLTRMKKSADPKTWNNSTYAIRSEYIHPKWGNSHFNLVSLHSSDIMKHAMDVSLLHITNQAMREVLRMRPEPSEATAKLVAPHKGRYLKTEALMAELNGQLRAELTGDEKAEVDAWLKQALKYKKPQLTCVQGSMTKNYLPNDLELSNIATSVKMNFNIKLRCQTPRFKGRSIALELGNTWDIENSNVTFLCRRKR